MIKTEKNKQELINRKHDHDLIEKGFDDFKEGKWYSENAMKNFFGKYGWGK